MIQRITVFSVSPAFTEFASALSSSLPLVVNYFSLGFLRAFSMNANGSPSGSEIAFGTEEL
jgi:hypothetical protein